MAFKIVKKALFLDVILSLIFKLFVEDWLTYFFTQSILVQGRAHASTPCHPLRSG
jgi:hypothetical protein